MTSDDECDYNSATESYGDRKVKAPSPRFWTWKIKLLVGFFIVFTLIFLGMLCILEFAKSTTLLKTVKTKRFVKMDDYYEDSESVMQNDVHIIPEEIKRQGNHHPNHRYLEMESEGNIYKKIMKDLYDESGWSPKPFEDVKTEEYLGSVQSIISKEKPKGNRLTNQYLKPLGASMRLKGVYGYVPEESEEEMSNNPNFYYSKEINNLMENYTGNGDNSPLKKAFKSHGAPFQGPVKDVTGKERLNVYRTNHPKSKQSWFKERHKKKPLTLLLDIYPMTGTDDYFKKEKFNFRHRVKPFRNEFFKLDVHPTGKFLFPHERRNGIIMKLNLYPKEGKSSRRRNSIGDRKETDPNENQRAEEKSFGWFYPKKEKKHESKECSLMGLKPDGKHVTAKWKNENGEWIHAKHVTVKYLKKNE